MSTPNFHPEYEAICQKLQDDCLRIVEERQIAIDKFTREQIADCFAQAVKCGDFQVHVVAGTPPGMHRQGVVYLPYARVFELEAKIEELKKQIADEEKRQENETIERDLND